MKIHFKTGDVVKVLSGDERGKSGKVLKVDRKKGTVLIEGLNQQSHYTRKSEKNPAGGIQKREGALPFCKVAKVESSATAAKTDKAPKAEKTSKK